MNSSLVLNNQLECYSSTYMFPVFAGETGWPWWIQASFYFSLLIYLFVGIALASDLFMKGIENITSQTMSCGNRTCLIWNPTVAVLTLYAFGSSAPEILLAIIELVMRGWVPGDLGAGTIVGSAAFNLYCITAVCMLGARQVQRVQHLSTFFSTFAWSLFAYVWLYLVLVYNSPNIVEMWEAACTFALFPIFVLFSFCIDKMSRAYLKCRATSNSSNCDLDDLEAQRLVGLPNDELFASTSNEQQQQPQSRINRLRRLRQYFLTTAHRHVPTKWRNVFMVMDRRDAQNQVPVVGFYQTQVVCQEDQTPVKIKLYRTGNLGCTSTCRFEFIRFANDENEAAEMGKHYEAEEFSVTFEPNAATAELTLKLINDKKPNKNRTMIIRLVHPDRCLIAPKDLSCAVLILDSGVPQSPLLKFDQLCFTISESGYVTLSISSVSVLSQPDTHFALHIHGTTVDKDVEHVFTNTHSSMFFTIKCEKACKISLVIVDDNNQRVSHSSCFAVYNYRDANSLAVQQDDEQEDTIGLFLTYDNNLSFAENWFRVFVVASKVMMRRRKVWRCLKFALTFPYRLLLATLVPPAHVWHGWPCFICALLIIGFLTALVNECATLFGCVLGLDNYITAISIVALGTSLPDTMASYISTQICLYCDAALNNITASNCVNVFAGLGLSWLLGSLYWWSKGVGGDLVVPAGTLGFSVGVYLACSGLALVILMTKRCASGGELGGCKATKWTLCMVFVSLWIVYLACSIMRVYNVL